MTQNHMDNIEQPVKPAMTDAQCEAMIAEYLTRKLAPVAKRTGKYSSLTVLVSIPDGYSAPNASYSCYSSGCEQALKATAASAVDFTLASIGDVGTAKRLREEAAAKITRAEQIEAAVMTEGEVTK